MRSHGRSTLTYSQVVLHMLKTDTGLLESDSGRWRNGGPALRADTNERSDDSPPSERRPMSAVASEVASPPTPVIAACVELGEEQLRTHELLDQLAKSLRPMLSREPAGDNARMIASPSHSPLHADMQDRVRRQREINLRLRCLTGRLVG